MNPIKAKEQLKNFLLEDIGDKDITSQMLFDTNYVGETYVIAKETGVMSGIDIISYVYQIIDRSISVVTYKQDGQIIETGHVVAKIKGSIGNILMGERVVLNVIQRMSGIATLTDRAVQLLNSSHTKISDTRKTTPGLRMFEKYAVTCGGGVNHRYGLYDGIMLKDNHIAMYGSIKKAVDKIRSTVGQMVKVEVETETIDQVKEAVSCGVDIIMFDNQDAASVRQLIQYVPKSIITEASGNITLNNISTYQHSGVDYISLGFITHSPKSLDISMKS
ncbi:putative nicotinate-nucleotide pyrophosphorylase [carboxylating] [Paraliobacillus sp. PM-2]|uniref:carboxylating nicotinate-nucleotide diphosphorylase n=1 Tax=Paraliobacillus sp. PM-2 TaxID=1462524 RepID=UPI00061BC1F5|nr:carboxylating nicotinate-nucleotide diphosphorylase [Paraliobacillus sp. PM-2]CQR46968.1 putative nicotinate-nucleotide pyrophosphorylase [carboxylating] [Paraliobacillus sp. PM-2]